MRYLGGKSKIRKQIATFLESVRKPEQVYFEPFCGGCHVTQEISGTRIAGDGNYALITMYRALQKGWIPPQSVTEELYAKYKANPNPYDPATAFIGIGCSFGGKWFGGYARQKGYDFAIGGTNAIMRQLPKIQDVEFRYGNYWEHNPQDMLIYCDPPYQGTTAYGAFKEFDHTRFWNTMRIWSRDNTVVISEYKAPDDFKCVLEIPTKTIIRDSDNKPILSAEKLFIYTGGIKC